MVRGKAEVLVEFGEKISRAWLRCMHSLSDELERNTVEGMFGQNKQCCGLGLIRAKLAETIGSMIGMDILVMNLVNPIREIF
jgi:hypothetical protein